VAPLRLRSVASHASQGWFWVNVVITGHERLVQGTACGAQAVGEDVDRHPVDKEGDGDPALVPGQRNDHGPPHGGGQVDGLGMLFGTGVLVRPDRRVVQPNLAVAPRVPPHVGGGLKDRELYAHVVNRLRPRNVCTLVSRLASASSAAWLASSSHVSLPAPASIGLMRQT
jgi:hypothetical protein